MVNISPASEKTRYSTYSNRHVARGVTPRVPATTKLGYREHAEGTTSVPSVTPGFDIVHIYRTNRDKTNKHAGKRDFTPQPKTPTLHFILVKPTEGDSNRRTVAVVYYESSSITTPPPSTPMHQSTDFAVNVGR